VRKILKVPAKNDVEKENENVRGSIANIRAREGVIGYILRNQKSASVDIEDPSKMIDYAILSSTVLDSGEHMKTTFELGKVDHILAEGEEVKVLSLTIGDHRISVFMNKKADHDAIYRDLRLK
jgi:predicted regulator of Ras-like GTPase activity (Roadblock/LC7/MglB family)